MKKRSTLLEMLGYASGDIYGGGAFLIFSTLYMNYLVIVEGLSVVNATTIIFVGKMWDAVTDPLMGFVSDHTKSRFGRRRVYFLFGAALVALSFFLMWNSFGIAPGSGLMLYHMLAYMLFGTAFTVVMVPYNAILSDMTTDYNQRTRYTAVRMMFSGGASLVCAVAPAMMIARLGSTVNGPAQKPGYLAMAAAFGLVFGIAWLATFFGTRENRAYQQPDTKSGLRQWRGLFQNRSYRVYLGIFLSVQIAIDLLLALFVFYIDIVLMNYQAYQVIMAVLMIFQLVFMGFVNVLAQKKGKAFPLLVGMPVWIAASFAFLFFTPSTPLAAVCVVAGVIAFGAACGNLCTWSMLSDSYDVGEVMTGHRHEGLYSGFTTFIRKFASGFSVLLMGIGLQAAGFNQNEYNLLKSIESASGHFDVSAYTGSAIVNAIKYMFVFVPVILLSITVAFALRYKLNNKRFATTREAIARFKQDGETATFSAEEAEDLEAVTGRPASRLWGRGEADNTSTPG